MRAKLRRFVACAVLACMMLGLLPAAAAAEGPAGRVVANGDGTVETEGNATAAWNGKELIVGLDGKDGYPVMTMADTPPFWLQIAVILAAFFMCISSNIYCAVSYCSNVALLNFDGCTYFLMLFDMFCPIRSAAKSNLSSHTIAQVTDYRLSRLTNVERFWEAFCL